MHVLSGGDKDFEDISEQLTFSKSEQQCVKVETVGDSVYEKDEQLTVEISSSSGKFESKSSTVTIKDDDEGVYYCV